MSATPLDRGPIDWRPIGTAPKGVRVKLLCPEGEDFGYYDSYEGRIPPASIPGEWSTDFGNGEPTHWLPLEAE